MAATPADVQAKIDYALKTIAGASAMKTYVQKNGSDPSKWPATTSMGVAAATLLTARAEVGQLRPSTVLHASFVEAVKP